MTDQDPWGTRRAAIQRLALTPPAVLALALVVIWAATGHGYFWPMWALLGLGIAAACVLVFRWARTQRSATSRR